MRGGGIDIRLKVGGGYWGRVRVRRRRRFCGRRMKSEGSDFDSLGVFVLVIGFICELRTANCLGERVSGFNRVDRYVCALFILFLVEYYYLP